MDEQIFCDDSAIWSRSCIVVFFIYLSVYGLLHNL